MKVKIIKPFTHPDSPRPFLPDELIEVSEDLGKQWIQDGKAIKFPIVPAHVAQARRRREKAAVID